MKELVNLIKKESVYLLYCLQTDKRQYNPSYLF
jgi:hypothetical protein